jgi:hypothetical protein
MARPNATFTRCIVVFGALIYEADAGGSRAAEGGRRSLLGFHPIGVSAGTGVSRTNSRRPAACSSAEYAG